MNLRSDLCDYSDAHVANNHWRRLFNKKKKSDKNDKNNSPFRLYISKINNALIDSGEDLGIFIPIYNLLECSDNYSMTSGSFSNYYRHEINDDAN